MPTPKNTPEAVKPVKPARVTKSKRERAQADVDVVDRKLVRNKAAAEDHRAALEFLDKEHAELASLRVHLAGHPALKDDAPIVIADTTDTPEEST